VATALQRTLTVTAHAPRGRPTLQKASVEDDKLKPWTSVAKYKLKAEEEIRKIPGYDRCPSQ